MNKLRLLIVEDDKEFVTSYKKQIAIFNEEQSNVFVEEVIAFEKDEAEKILKEGQIDAAIIDLKLGNTDVQYKGNELLEIIKKNLRFPTYVVTANPEKIEEEKSSQNDLYKLKVKGSEESNFTTILNELSKIHLTGITKILGKSGQIEKYLNEIFWKHLSNSINLWASDNSRTPDQKEKSLLRYTLSHIQEHLDIDDTGSFEDLFPAEFYIYPPVNNNLVTGDIVTYTGSRFIVLTPACDLILRKDGKRNADFIMLCKIKLLDQIVTNFSTLSLSTSEKNESRIKLCNYIENKNQRFHFVPPSNEIKAGLIDFQEKITLPSVEVDDLIKRGGIIRIATVSVPFLKDIISRYSNNFSRQGSPNFNISEIYRNLF